MYTSRELKKMPNSRILDDIVSIVKMKLAGHELPLPPSTGMLDVQSIAVLSARLLLDLSPATSRARSYERELIRSHLRVVYSVHKDRETVISGSSPEPLIAEAAAQIMNGSDTMTPAMDTWKLLLEYVDNGLGGQGDIGELIGRALSILAMDAAINNLDDVCELKYQTPILVNDYYKALLTDEAWDILQNSFPANPHQLTSHDAQKNFKDAFSGAYFHFSHYARANDGTPLNRHYGWALWLRGTAILCQLNQEYTDRAIPIFFRPQGEKISSESMSYVLDQDKAGVTADPQGITIQSAEKLNVFSGSTSLPYIAAVHCYALERDERLAVGGTQRPNQNRPALTQNTAAPRYQINIRGLEPYRVLDPSTQAAIRSTINRTKSYLFEKHPRQYGVPVLRQMQPFLTGEPETSAWFGGYQ